AFAKKHPGRASGLCLVASQAGADTPETKAGRYQSIEAVTAAGTAALIDTMAPKLTADPRLQESLRALMSRQSPTTVIGALGAMAERKDLTGFLSSFADPLVLVHGDADTLIPLARAYAVKAAAPSALVVEVPGVGHMPMLENPTATAAGILKMLAMA
ncbi:alpha/beta fold hydrolase, partial [bacterium]|nr:alpha/beta fold hydrolase [bacterium]